MVGSRDNENREMKKKERRKQGKKEEEEDKEPGVGLDVKYPTLGTRTLD